MKVNKGTRLLAFFVTFLFFSTSLQSQVVVETSQEKVIISGIPYYIHQVKKGQTAYSISRAYGITVEDLTKENPPALYGVREGQSLRIPIRVEKDQVTEQGRAVKKDESKFIYHSLKPGETVYSLSRLYGVSDNEIVLSNPGIDINKLAVGSEIAVPRRQFMSEREKFDDQEKKFIYHKVAQGETLASIAQKYGITLRALRRENRNLRFPQVGDYVRVPGAKITEQEIPEMVIADTLPQVVEEPLVKLERPADYTIVKDLNGSFDIAVLLPFYFSENSQRRDIDSSKIVKGRRQYKILKKPDDWIYPHSLDFLEMYAGILLAADTLRSLGLDINISAHDIKGDTLGITRLIRTGKLSDMDLIIGPVYSSNLNIVSKYAKDLGIPVVSPVALINNSVLKANPTLFMANSSLAVAQKALAKKISEDNNNNLVFIHTDTLGNDIDVRNFKDQILNELSYKMPFEDIKFKEFIFYSRSTFGNDSIIRLSHALSENTGNTVIVASEDPPVISEIITIIHGLSKRYDVKVFGYPSVSYIDNLDPKVFFDLEMLILSNSWIDYSKGNVRQFNLNYRKKFLTMPLEHSFAWIGYDIIYYFISGLAIHGKEFIEHPEIHRPALLQNDFEFEREDLNRGFENQKLFNIRYTKDYEVKLLE